MGSKLTTEIVIERINEVHNNKFDLSSLLYVNKRTKVEVICFEHGSFFTKIEQLLRGQGCPECGLISQGKKRRLTQNQFINKSVSVHGLKYDYNNSDYQGMNKKIIITCKIHGDFFQTPSSHLNGSGCPHCGLVSQGDKRKLGLEEFVVRSKMIHGDRYDYSNVNYENSLKKVEIICLNHGVFIQQPQNHLNGSGCPKCSIIENHENQKKTTDEFISDSILVHGDKYDYSKVNYFGGKKEVIIICEKHGEFRQTPNNHQRGNGCPNCNSSKGEMLIVKYLTDNNIEFEQQYTFEGLRMKRKLKCDFYLPNHNSIIEFNGSQHYIPVERFGGEEGLIRTQNSDDLKRKFCFENEIKLLEIKYNEDVYDCLNLFLSL
jgi:hypothetical protein